MKIVLINNIYFPEGTGGGEMVVRHRAFEYASNGNEVYIVVPGEKYSKENLSPNLTLIRFKPMHIFIYKNASKYPWVVRLIWHIVDMFNIAKYFQLKKILKLIKPDRVECHNLKGVGFFIPSLLKALKIPYSMYLHDVQLAIPSGILLHSEEAKSVNNGIFQKLYEKSIKSLVKSSNEVISPSKWLLEFYTKKGFFKASKKTVLSINEKKINKEAIKKKLNNLQEKIKKNEIVTFIFVGKLEVYKGVSILLQAWKGLPKNFNLVIYGTGSLQQSVLDEKINGSNIELMGYRPHAELIPAIKNADMLIMPTLCYENRPEVILEALEAGTPVAGSSLGGIPELIENSVTGYLFPPGDAKKIRSLITFNPKEL